jgi:hypothetical protein
LGLNLFDIPRCCFFFFHAEAKNMANSRKTGKSFINWCDGRRRNRSMHFFSFVFPRKTHSLHMQQQQQQTEEYQKKASSSFCVSLIFNGKSLNRSSLQHQTSKPFIIF